MPVLSRSHFRLWRFAFRRLRYLCFDIFLRRFLTNDPMQKPRFRVGRRHMVAPLGDLIKPKGGRSSDPADAVQVVSTAHVRHLFDQR